MFSRSSQTVQADIEAAARANVSDAPDAASDGGFRAKANAWLRELEGLGADAHVDGAGGVHRASARPPLAPRWGCTS
jgi:hypothetical protein